MPHWGFSCFPKGHPLSPSHCEAGVGSDLNAFLHVVWVQAVPAISCSTGLLRGLDTPSSGEYGQTLSQSCPRECGHSDALRLLRLDDTVGHASPPRVQDPRFGTQPPCPAEAQTRPHVQAWLSSCTSSLHLTFI